MLRRSFLRLCLPLLLCGCSSPPPTRAEFANDLRQVVTVSRNWTKDYKNRDLLGQASQKASEVLNKYRGSEIATQDCKSEFESLGMLSTSLALAKTAADPSQPPSTSPTSALDLSLSSLAMLSKSKLLSSPSPQPTP